MSDTKKITPQKTGPTEGTPDDDSTPIKIDKAAQPPDNATPTKSKRDTRSLMPSKDIEEEDEIAYSTQHNYPPLWTRAEPMSKELADYKLGEPFHRCGLCTYYQSNHCKVVRGYISPEMGCKYFQEKYDPDRFKISISDLRRGRR